MEIKFSLQPANFLQSLETSKKTLGKIKKLGKISFELKDFRVESLKFCLLKFLYQFLIAKQKLRKFRILIFLSVETNFFMNVLNQVFFFLNKLVTVFKTL